MTYRQPGAYQGNRTPPPVPIGGGQLLASASLGATSPISGEGAIYINKTDYIRLGRLRRQRSIDATAAVCINRQTHTHDGAPAKKTHPQITRTFLEEVTSAAHAREALSKNPYHNPHKKTYKNLHLSRGGNVRDAHPEGLIGRPGGRLKGVDGLQEGGAVVPGRQRPSLGPLRNVLRR